MIADQWRKNNRLDVDSFKENNIQREREDVRSSPYPHAEACFPTIFTSVSLTNAVVERVTAHSDCRVQHIDLHTHTNCLFRNGNNNRRTERRKMQIRHFLIELLRQEKDIPAVLGRFLICTLTLFLVPSRTSHAISHGCFVVRVLFRTASSRASFLDVHLSECQK